MKINLVKWSQFAIDNFNESVDYLEQENPIAARKLTNLVENNIQLLVEFSHLGCEGRIFGTREFKISKFPYIIVYKVRGNCIEIVDVLPTKVQYPYKS